MSPWLVLICLGGYFALLLLISALTSGKGDSAQFYLGGRKSHWMVIAYGMIGASLSGITFISVPGWVGDTQFFYFQMVMGYLVGYAVIALVLMPLYYSLGLTSIYEYLRDRFGPWSYKCGAWGFLISRTIGASFRMYLVAMVLHQGLFAHWGLPFGLTVLLTIGLIWVYTYKGGIGTIIYTDTLQTTFMLAALVLTLVFVIGQLQLDWSSVVQQISSSPDTQIFNWDWTSRNFFGKQFIAGAFIAIVMTGLDQDMMQKNLSCRNIKDAQKNMLVFSLILLVVNFIFLVLGYFLYAYSEAMSIGLPAKSDQLYPMLAFEYFPVGIGVLFVLGLVAAAYSSADSALTALTTSFLIDIMGRKDQDSTPGTRYKVHLLFSALMVGTILLFHEINNEAVISELFTAAGYTYGPLLGLFAFGLLTPYRIRDMKAPWICILAPLATWALNHYLPLWIPGFKFGFELLLVNGALTFAGLWLISHPRSRVL